MVPVTRGTGNGSQRAVDAFDRARAAIRAQERADTLTGGTRGMGMWPELEQAILQVVDGWRRPAAQPNTPGGAETAPSRVQARVRTRTRYIGGPSERVQLSSPSRAELDADWTAAGRAERGA